MKSSKLKKVNVKKLKTNKMKRKTTNENLVNNSNQTQIVKKQNSNELKINRMKDKLPQFVEEGFDNVNTLIQYTKPSFDKDFKFNCGTGDGMKKLSITCLGIQMTLTNPETGKLFSVLVSDDELTPQEFNFRLELMNESNGCLIHVGEQINKRNITLKELNDTIKN